jgi:hypothetical protein
MKLARAVFIVAGIWGIAVLGPLYALVDVSGRRYAPPAEYPHFFYGFIGVALAWQIAFLLIGSNPSRFRPLMIPAVIEKLGFVVTTLVLYRRERIPWQDAQAAIPDLLLCVLFVAAFVTTGRTSTDVRLKSEASY